MEAKRQTMMVILQSGMPERTRSARTDNGAIKDQLVELQNMEAIVQCSTLVFTYSWLIPDGTQVT
jgi:hypothetical protein